MRIVLITADGIKRGGDEWTDTTPPAGLTRYYVPGEPDALFSKCYKSRRRVYKLSHEDRGTTYYREIADLPAKEDAP